jgi:HD superfamily phosphohydrolase
MEGKRIVFNDPVHGHISLHPACKLIMDTPEFQRLRDLQQLGGVYSVFAGASHKRFEHSIGVAYLARTLMDHVLKNQPELTAVVSDQEVLCVELAGLIHDLGHGPYSHLFDRMLIRRVYPDIDWEHEHASIDMFDHLMQVHGLHEKFSEQWGLEAHHLHLIKELVFGDPSAAPKTWEWIGVDPSKAFLFDVVANKRTGMDVDKFDYFARDCYQLNIPASFDSKRLVEFCRVLDVDGRAILGYHEKEVWNIYNLFMTRYNLHKRAYQHRVSRVVELMIVEALQMANDHYFLPGKPLSEGGERAKVRMSDAIRDMHAYTLLTDSVLKDIERSQDPKLAPAREVLQRLHTRTFYPYIGEEIIPVAFYQQAQEEYECAVAGNCNPRNAGGGSSTNTVIAAGGGGDCARGPGGRLYKKLAKSEIAREIFACVKADDMEREEVKEGEDPLHETDILVEIVKVGLA